MIPFKRLRGRAIAAYLGPAGDAARHLAHEARRRITRQPERLDFYFDLGDPWSYLAAQAVQRLVDAYDVPFEFHFVAPPASDVNPEPVLRQHYAVRDARALMNYWDVEFPGKRELEVGGLRRGGSMLIKERAAKEQLTCALEIAAAMWSADAKRMNELLGKYGTEAQIAVPTVIASNYDALRKRGHYQGAMIAYRGEWYWGIDRVAMLEEVLAAERGVPVVGVVKARPESARPIQDSDRLIKGTGPVPVEVWFSFRSPYSYLAIEQLDDALRPFDVTVKLRPVAPMVERGIKLPSEKRTYIALDAKRCADRLGIPFGNLCDPLGKAVDHCIAISHGAATRGAGADLAFARSALRGIWSEARDLAEYVDLRHVVERAGLSWDDAKAWMADPAGAEAAAVNAADLNVIGLWGVPSFRAGDYTAWGHDRLPLLVDKLRRHAVAPLPPPPAAST